MLRAQTLQKNNMTTLNIGEVSITRVEESLGPSFDPHFLFPDWTSELLTKHCGWMSPNYLDEATGKFISSIHSWVLRTPRHTILIDACSGDHKNRPAFPRFHMKETSYLERLTAAGVNPDNVDFVLCTHLHVDHVGWNTRLANGRWVPTFPNARYVFARSEVDYWHTRNGEGGHLPINENVFDDSVAPIIDAGLAIFVDGFERIGEVLTIIPSPGHSPGHCSVELTIDGKTGIFSGDVMHQPVQVYEPHLNSRFCSHPEQARDSRRKLLARCAADQCLVLPAHFGAPHFGRIVEKAGRYRFVCGI